MEQEREFDQGLTDLESALKDLAPGPARLDIAHTMFLAGQQSMHCRLRRQALWPLSTACLALLCITLTVLLATPGPPRIVYVRQAQRLQPDVMQQPTSNVAPSASVADQQYVSPTNSHHLAPPPWYEDRDGALHRLAWRHLDLNNTWAPPAQETQVSESIPINTVRYSDWRSLLDDVSLAERVREPGASPLLNWTRFLTTRGS